MKKGVPLFFKVVGSQCACTSHGIAPLKNRLAVAREKPAKIARKSQKVQFIQSNFFTSKSGLSNLILFTCFAKFAKP